MKNLISIILLIISIQTLNAQNNITMTAKYGVESRDLKKVLNFEDIKFETFTFNGDLTNKNYLISIQEYQNGELISRDTLIDSKEAESLKISSNTLNLTFLSQNKNDNLAIQVTGDGFSSRKLNYETSSKNGKYALKDFLGAKRSEKVPSNQKFPLFGIITPTIYADGTGSYCDVAQSGIAPGELGKRFDIPHYFIIQMEIK